MSERMSEEEFDAYDDSFYFEAEPVRRLRFISEARRARTSEAALAARVEKLEGALREIIFGIENHDETGGWLPMNATEVVAIARRALADEEGKK